MPMPPLPTDVPPGIPILGQPATLQMIRIRVDATLICNCGGPDTTVVIVQSVQGECPSCHKVYNAAFNPVTLKLETAMGIPGPVPSV